VLAARRSPSRSKLLRQPRVAQEIASVLLRLTYGRNG
jgi:hypothetical protein